MLGDFAQAVAMFYLSLIYQHNDSAKVIICYCLFYVASLSIEIKTILEH